MAQMPTRRHVLKAGCAALAGAATGALSPLTPGVRSAPSPASAAETAVQELYHTLSDLQKKEICFDWNYRDPKRGLLRTFVANHWQITRPVVRSPFFSKKQQLLIHDIFTDILSPEWYPRFLQQLRDDTYGHEWGADQSIGIFGVPGERRFEFVFTGRHVTLRADGNTDGRVAFGGPIFYGHAPGGFTETAHHPGNVFWPQAQAANQVYAMLDGVQRRKALVAHRPDEAAVGFYGPRAQLPGVPVAELDAGQKQALRKTLSVLVEPFRKEDQDAALACLDRQGGLDACSLAYYEEGSLAAGEWDNWRLEGPSFVWYFRGTPHVHVWVNVANRADLELNAHNGVYLHPNHDPLGAPSRVLIDP